MSAPATAAGDEAVYDAGSIVLLSGLEAVRQSPAMYVGSTGREGVLHLVDELVDNAVDEAAAGYCTQITLTLHADGSCAVEDDGRGIPVDPHEPSGRPAAEVVLTTLHSGAKFSGQTYGRSAGLHGVGLACVNALSSQLVLQIHRDGQAHRQAFARGEVEEELVVVGPSEHTGTTVRIWPDDSVFDDTTFDRAAIERRLEDAAFLQPGLRLTLIDEELGQTQVFTSERGLSGLLATRLDGSSLVHGDPIVLDGVGEGASVEVALGWTSGYAEDLSSFVNGVRTDAGGSHVDGLRTALARTVNEALRTQDEDAVTTLDVLEGLVAVISLRVLRPRFGDQTKTRLRDADIGRCVDEVVGRELAARFATDDALRAAVLERALEARRARMIARLATRAARYEHRQLEVDYEVYQRQFGIRSDNWHDSCAWLTDGGLLAGHAAHCAVPEEAELLDVCCGSGVVGAAFEGKVARKIGLDITPQMVKLASTRLDEVHQGTVYDLPFDDDRFDIAVTREVLHLLPQPERPLAEIFRVLKPGGQFIVGQIVPYGAIDAFWMFRVFKKKQPLLYQMFLEEEFRQLLLSVGFRLTDVTEYLLWESIDLWIDTHETTPAHRQEIHRLFHEAPDEVRAAHPFEIGEDGTIRDQWRWCIYSLTKPHAR